MRYIYGWDPSEALAVDSGKDLIIAADKYGIVDLKMTMEAKLVHLIKLKRKNVADWLLFANSMNCPLLKEHVTNYFVSRSADLIGSEHLEKLKESPKIMSELMKELSTRMNNDPRFVITPERNMPVNELRKKLSEEGLDVDGSKEMLLSRLNESNKRQRTE